MSLIKRPFVLSLLLLLLCQALPAREYDPDNGEEINEVCAGCHGEYGQGGNEGEYPRLAAQPPEFLAEQLHLFRDRKRPNIAMIEYVDDRQMPEEDIQDVSIFLSRIKLKTKLPPVDETAPDFDAYARLLESKRLMQIPLAEGDVERGRKLYAEECRSCHGKLGWGSHKKNTPMLAGQYTNYMWRQVQKLRKRIRIHEKDEPDQELLDDVKDADLTDIFAFLSTVDD